MGFWASRMGFTTGFWTALSYTYSGNQLYSVSDEGNTEGIYGSFKDRVSENDESPEYIYNLNGALVRDLNKGIEAINYNYLNLPMRIDMGNSKKIDYLYDAAGIKLRQRSMDSDTLVGQTDYIGEAVYENDNMQFLHTSQGRVLKEDGKWVYEYHHHDHLGIYAQPFESADT